MEPSVFEPSTSTEVQYGAIYPDGRVDWNVHTWFGAIDTRERRKAFAAQYVLQMASFGITGVSVSFIQRTIITTALGAEWIIDPEPPASPEPATTPSEEPGEEATPPADDIPPAAPGEDAEPPAIEAPVEEESPVEQDGPEPTEPEPSPADDKGVNEDGGQL